jgi:predicted ATPase
MLLISHPSSNAQAERSFHTSIDLARTQGARAWELRATASLARLLRRQGQTEEARKILTQIHSWFTEGSDTADLKEAKALLDELSV